MNRFSRLSDARRYRPVLCGLVALLCLFVVDWAATDHIARAATADRFPAVDQQADIGLPAGAPVRSECRKHASDAQADDTSDGPAASAFALAAGADRSPSCAGVDGVVAVHSLAYPSVAPRAPPLP